MLLQRFYYVESVREFSVAETAMGAVFLASKITERPAKIADIVGVFRRLRGLKGLREGEEGERWGEKVGQESGQERADGAGAVQRERKGSRGRDKAAVIARV